MVTGPLAAEFVGVPDRTPVALSSANPLGSCPEIIDQLTVPDAPVSWRFWENWTLRAHSRFEFVVIVMTSGGGGGGGGGDVVLAAPPPHPVSQASIITSRNIQALPGLFTRSRPCTTRFPLAS